LLQNRTFLLALNLPQDDPVRRRPDISLARQKLGWEPNVPVRDGLSRTIAYFREHK
jgi:UDP-glucuronate decarboxylase